MNTTYDAVTRGRRGSYPSGADTDRGGGASRKSTYDDLSMTSNSVARAKEEGVRYSGMINEELQSVWENGDAR